MSSFQNNQTPCRSGRGGQGSSSDSLRDTPRHGRIPSTSNAQPAIPGHRTLLTVTVPPRAEPNELQRWAGESLRPFLRWAYAVIDRRGNARPNHDFNPDINNAIHVSETIDAFDADSRLIQELILRIANPDLGHPSMDWIRQNRSLVELLLYRHYQRHGGLVLPPVDPGLQAMRQHEAAVAAARTARVAEDQLPRVAFPIWDNSEKKGEEKAKGKGRGPSRGHSGGTPFADIGSKRPSGGGRDGEAPGGSIAL